MNTQVEWLSSILVLKKQLIDRLITIVNYLIRFTDKYIARVYFIDEVF